MDEKHFDLIMDCVDEFDFHKVHKIMEHLDWHWSTEDGGVPSIATMRRTARKILQEVIRRAIERKNEGGEFILGTGGFRYECKIYEDGFVWVRMAFEIDSWDNAE